ncbi:MAG: hypothetical protein ACOCQ4_02440 [bacterium]
MKKVIWLIAVTVSLSVFYMSCSEKDENITVLKSSKKTYTGNSQNYYKKALISNSRSFRLEHLNERYVDGERIYATLNKEQDSILVINKTSKETDKIKLPFKYQVPVHSIYFHNYDSIFVFLERSAKVKVKKSKGVSWDDFILIDSSGTVIDKYTLDSVPHIYNGQLEPMIFKRKWKTTQNMIKQDKLYIPYSIYRPGMDKEKLLDLDLKLMCEFDLNNKSYRMLDIQIPDKDVGKKFRKRLIEGYLDFFIHKDKIYYSFFHSPDIYQYDLTRGKGSMVKTFEDLPFQNIVIEVNDSNKYHYSHFFAPVYSDQKNVFVREISVRDYKNFTSFKVSQLLDDDFNLIGYHFEDSIFSNINVGPNGNLITRNKETEKFYIVNELEKLENAGVNYVEEKILEPKQIDKKPKINKMPYKQRIKGYLEDLDLLEHKEDKIALISTSIVCVNCIDFLFSTYHNQKTKNFKYVIYGDDMEFIHTLLDNYGISAGNNIIIDSNKIFKAYIKEKEYKVNPFVDVHKDNTIDITKYETQNIKNEFEVFISE